MKIAGNLRYLIEIKKTKLIFQAVLDLLFLIVYGISLIFSENFVLFVVCISILVIDILVLIGTSIGQPFSLINSIRSDYMIFCNSLAQGKQSLIASITILQTLSIVINSLFSFALYIQAAAHLDIILPIDSKRVLFYVLLFYSSELFVSIVYFFMINKNNNIFFFFCLAEYAILYAGFKLDKMIDNICFSYGLIAAIFVMSIIMILKGKVLLKENVS